jgi:ABC-2 type transport system ATP-binding protein
MFEPVIEVENLTRYFDSDAVVREMNMRIPAGQVTALLGLNGAGKTTTIRIILGLLRPTRGNCRVFGEDTQAMSPETRGRIGYMVEGHYLYPSMRVQECADFQKAGFQHWDERLFRDIISHFNIRPDARTTQLSRGQRAGVSLALVLAPDPELLVLDDPALGLDPVSRRALNETLVEFVGRGQRTALLSTHLLDDVERVADRVAVMVNGRLKVDTTLDDFRDRVRGFAMQLPEIEIPKLASIPGLIEVRKIGDRVHVAVADADQETHASLERLQAISIEPSEMAFSEAVLAYLAPHRRDISFFRHDQVSSGVAQ